MKICPNCEQENPSSANHCMVCGALLVDEEHLPEDVLLKKELGEAKETIELLKKSLSALQEKSEKAGDGTDAQQLKDQIEICNATIETLSRRASDQKTEITNLTHQLEDERKKKKGGKWGWLFVLLFFAAVIAAYVNWDEKQSQDRYYTDEINRLSRDLSSLRQEKENSSAELDNQRTNYIVLETKFDELKNQYPLIVDDIQIANVNVDGEIETDYGDYLYSGRTMYLKPKLTYRGFADSRITLKVKWAGPEEALITDTSSPVDFSQSAEYSIYEGNQTLVLSGLGGSTMGYWGSGSYHIEIWYGEVMLKTKSFYIYAGY